MLVLSKVYSLSPFLLPAASASNRYLRRSCTPLPNGVSSGDPAHASHPDPSASHRPSGTPLLPLFSYVLVPFLSTFYCKPISGQDRPLSHHTNVFFRLAASSQHIAEHIEIPTCILTVKCIAIGKDAYWLLERRVWITNLDIESERKIGDVFPFFEAVPERPDRID